jgi:hypothetical protein
MDRLIAACKPSELGERKELVHDETYWSAFELASDRHHERDPPPIYTVSLRIATFGVYEEA